MSSHLGLLLGIVIPALHLAGVAASVHVIMHGRTAQGAIAWVLSLVFLPYIALPLYLVFGRAKFQGYIAARRFDSASLKPLVKQLQPYLPDHHDLSAVAKQYLHAIEELAHIPFTKNNDAQLLIDGQETFSAIFDAIDKAQEYILVQFFIIHDDELGRELKQRLLRKAAEGVRIYLLYDMIGCHSLPKSYLEELTAAGIACSGFKTMHRWTNRLQLNFRNHRKIVVVDGRTAFLGGLNVGDEYMSRSERFGHWRDTHVSISGPAVLAVQLSFMEDWYCATHDFPKLQWVPVSAEDDGKEVVILPSGPADTLETCGLFFVHAINSATSRVWITSPYFVPDTHITTALQVAALRGVDVRIMLPEKPDHLLVYLSSFSYLRQADDAGIKIYRYQPGFLHQKVMLIDDDIAAVGTVNLDNRSFRINFEITMLCVDRQFAKEVAAMLAHDFSTCQQESAASYEQRSFWFRLAVCCARLLAPIQ